MPPRGSASAACDLDAACRVALAVPGCCPGRAPPTTGVEPVLRVDDADAPPLDFAAGASFLLRLKRPVTLLRTAANGLGLSSGEACFCVPVDVALRPPLPGVGDAGRLPLLDDDAPGRGDAPDFASPAASPRFNQLVTLDVMAAMRPPPSSPAVCALAAGFASFLGAPSLSPRFKKPPNFAPKPPPSPLSPFASGFLSALRGADAEDDEDDPGRSGTPTDPLEKPPGLLDRPPPDDDEPPPLE